MALSQKGLVDGFVSTQKVAPAGPCEQMTVFGNQATSVVHELEPQPYPKVADSSTFVMNWVQSPDQLFIMNL